jgi:outer membrane protein TolC|tara:strand:- start:460 stop:903 length:444 start_codon:yes stop_codon:yes gene_type:complete
MNSGYNWNNQERSFDGGRTSWSLGLSLSYPIFNNFQRESSLDRAQFSQRVARLQEDDSRLAARQEADAALYNLRTAERAIEIAQEAELVAGEDLRVVRERYSVGVATILDVLISQNAADQASVDVVTSRYDYVLARAELESILGRVL